MRYALVKNNQIVEGPKNLPKAWGNVSGFHLLTNEQLLQYGWLPWELVEITVNQNEVYDVPTISIFADRVVETQTKRAKTTQEISQDIDNKKQNIRFERNQMLADCDWIVIKSLETNSDFTDWKIYRQALRDITSQETFPNVVWPTKPEV